MDPVYDRFIGNETNASAVEWTISAELGDPQDDPLEALFIRDIPAYLRDRPITDGLVAQALEQWAATKAATIMVGIFLVAAVVTLIAVVPALLLRARPGHDGPTESDEPGETEFGEIAF